MLDTTLWITQSFLALFFFAAGLPKVIGRGIDRWVGFDDLPRPMVIVIGVCEVAAAVALVVPMVAGLGEWTTPLAALGLAAVSLSASGFHIRQDEWLCATETALWASLATSIAIGRWDEFATGPSISVEWLVPVVAVLVPATIANLVLLFGRPVRANTENERPQVSAR
ncbi:MAG: DoxX family protein [Nocardioidaceae bacterium]